MKSCDQLTQPFFPADLPPGPFPLRRHAFLVLSQCTAWLGFNVCRLKRRTKPMKNAYPCKYLRLFPWLYDIFIATSLQCYIKVKILRFAQVTPFVNCMDRVQHHWAGRNLPRGRHICRRNIQREKQGSSATYPTCCPSRAFPGREQRLSGFQFKLLWVSAYRLTRQRTVTWILSFSCPNTNKKKTFRLLDESEKQGASAC